MSTLKVNQIQDASGGNSSTAEQIAQGRAKVRCSYNGANNTIIDSFSISSVTDNGTGDFTFNYSITLTNPCPFVMTVTRSNQTSGSTPPGVRSPDGHSDAAAGSTNTTLRILHRPTNSNRDGNFYCIAVFGD